MVLSQGRLEPLRSPPARKSLFSALPCKQTLVPDATSKKIWRELVCRRSKPSNVLGKMLARGRRLQHKQANLFARKSITYARVSTEPAIRSRRLPSDFPRPGEPVLNSLRHRRERPRRGKRAAERNPIADRKAEDVLAAFPVPCGARAIRRHRVAPYRSTREVQPTAVPAAAAVLPHEKQREPASAPAALDPGALGDEMTFWPRINTGDDGCSAIYVSRVHPRPKNLMFLTR
jgi:hypothetical protein